MYGYSGTCQTLYTPMRNATRKDRIIAIGTRHYQQGIPTTIADIADAAYDGYANEEQRKYTATVLRENGLPIVERVDNRQRIETLGFSDEQARERDQVMQDYYDGYVDAEWSWEEYHVALIGQWVVENSEGAGAEARRYEDDNKAYRAYEEFVNELGGFYKNEVAQRLLDEVDYAMQRRSVELLDQVYADIVEELDCNTFVEGEDNYDDMIRTMEMINDVRKQYTGESKVEAEGRELAEALNELVEEDGISDEEINEQYEGETPDEKANNIYWDLHNEMSDLTCGDYDTDEWNNLYDIQAEISSLYELNDRADEARGHMEQIGASEQEQTHLNQVQADIQDAITYIEQQAEEMEGRLEELEEEGI